MNTDYIKDYKEKELKQFISAYFLVTAGIFCFHAFSSAGTIGLIPAILEMASFDFFNGGISILVIVLNELWPDKLKTKIVYWKMPSDSVFSEIAIGNVDSTGLDIEKAKKMYSHLSNASPNKQTTEWNLMLKKCRDEQHGNVIEAERMQLMTRDLCVSTISLLIMNLVVLLFSFIFRYSWGAIDIFCIPIVYIFILFVVTKYAARNRAKRFVMMVIKNDVQNEILENHYE